MPTPRSLRPLAILALCVLAGGVRAQGEAPVVLRYWNAPAEGRPLLRPPTLGLAVGASLHRAVLDTGSTGVVIAASSIGDLARLPDLGPGRLAYSSSGRVMLGRYVRAPVTIVGADGTRLTTRPLPVLAVTRVECLPRARACTPQEAPRHIAMIGIGFGRERDHQPQGTPQANPFLNLPGMAEAGEERPARLGRGYVLTRTHAQVGRAPGDDAGFTLVRLTRAPELDDWSAVPACLSLAGRRPPACGSLLMDTGVARMFITVPGAQSAGLLARNGQGAAVLKDGTRLEVLPAPGAPAPAYAITLSDESDPKVPTEALVVDRPGRPAFINTTVRFLNGFDYAFDAEAGTVGFRPLRR